MNKSFGNKLRVYNQEGLQTQSMHLDLEFKSTGDTFKDINIMMNYTIEQEHVTEIERKIKNQEKVQIIISLTPNNIEQSMW